MQKKYRVYFIVMADYDTFEIRVEVKDRPNNITDDEVIAEYMHNNYYGHSYDVIDKHNGKYEIVKV